MINREAVNVFHAFHVPAGHLFVFLGKLSIQVFCTFKNHVPSFLMLSCMSYFNILDSSPLTVT